METKTITIEVPDFTNTVAEAILRTNALKAENTTLSRTVTAKEDSIKGQMAAWIAEAFRPLRYEDSNRLIFNTCVSVGQMNHELRVRGLNRDCGFCIEIGLPYGMHDDDVRFALSENGQARLAFVSSEENFIRLVELWPDVKKACEKIAQGVLYKMEEKARTDLENNRKLDAAYSGFVV